MRQGHAPQHLDRGIMSVPHYLRSQVYLHLFVDFMKFYFNVDKEASASGGLCPVPHDPIWALPLHPAGGLPAVPQLWSDAYDRSWRHLYIR